MCYRPIHIFNPVRTYNADQPMRIAVPCGKCADCARIKQNEWFFRSYIEYQHYKNIGGACYFVTLTYSDDNLPMLDIPACGGFPALKQPCFSRLHVRNFIKYIRIWLKRHCYPSDGIKFLVCSEYGSNTQRPHYHGLLFLPFHLNFWSNSIALEDRIGHTPFEYFITRVWQHGFVICSKQGWEITSVSGIRYASKYVAKDFTFYNIPSFKFLEYMSDDDKKLFMKANADCFPKHWQSVGYGESFCDVINSQKDIPAFLANNRVSLWSGSDGVFPIPRYYHLKIEKKINKQYSKLLDKVVLERTEIGTKVREIRLHECVLKDMQNLKYINSEHIQNNLPQVDILLSQFNYLSQNVSQSYTQLDKLFRGRFLDLSSYSVWRFNLASELPMLLNTIDLHRLSLYRCFLRYTPIFEDEVPEHKFLEISDMIKNILYPSVYPPEYKDVIVPSGLSEFASPLRENVSVRHLNLCKHHPYFQQYEYVCTLLDDFDNISSITKEFNTLYKIYLRKKCKHYYGSKPITYKSNF